MNNLDNMPKRIKITQSVLLIVIYILACIWAYGSINLLNTISFIFMILASILSLFHYVSGDKFLAFNNICLGGFIYIIFTFVL